MSTLAVVFGMSESSDAPTTSVTSPKRKSDVWDHASSKLRKLELTDTAAVVDNSIHLKEEEDTLQDSMQIFVQGPDGKTIAVQISATEDISTLSEYLTDKTGENIQAKRCNNRLGIPQHMHCLSYHGKILDMNGSLGEYGILPGIHSPFFFCNAQYFEGLWFSSP